MATRVAGEGLLGPQDAAHRRKQCLVLDLDETLVHSSFKPVPNPDFIIPVEIEGKVGFAEAASCCQVGLRGHCAFDC